MQSISADFVFTSEGLAKECILEMDAEGRIDFIGKGRVETHLPGIIAPPFVNAHCHLELSHLAGELPRGTGMAGFIEQLQGIRNAWGDGEREMAISAAIEQLEGSGTGAIADICNGPHSIAPKAAHPGIIYHNLCEVFSLDPRQADTAFERGLDLATQFTRPANPTLHAPYSMSPRLRDLLCRHTAAREVPLSIHLLESAEERQLFEDLEGPLFDLFRKWGLPWSPSTYDSALDYVLERLPRKTVSLLVHCTEMRKDEFKKVVEGWPKAYFVLCPRANDFIHGSLPDAKLFAQAPDRICIGTDSLAGNDSLDMLEEIKLLQSTQGIPTETLLQWATHNGARALALPQDSFSIALGNRPQLVHISQVAGENANFTSESRARPIHLP